MALAVSLVVVLLAAFIEIASFVSGRFVAPGMFSEEEAYFSSIDAQQFAQWQASPWFDEELGWNTPTLPTSETKPNCLGMNISYSYSDEARGTPRFGIPVVAIFGDSYAFGDEVGDDLTPAAALERLIDAPVLNYAVRGFSPEQAVLKFERMVQKRTLPDVAVLIIAHENIRRVVNSFRPVLYSWTDVRFGLKPYVDGETLVTTPYPRDYEAFLQEARRRFAQDFWARPRLSFPFSVSLLDAATSNSFYFTKIKSRGRPPYSFEYADENALRKALSATINRWRSSVSAKGIKPFVLFVPSTPADNGIATDYVAGLNASAGKTFVFEFDDPDMDWRRYNLAPLACHPSPYGYERIASFIARRILSSR